MIDFDEAQAFDFSPELVKKITRPRAIKILELIQEAREVIINTHPEPDTLRLTYSSDWFSKLVEAQPKVIDPNGTIRFLQKIDALFVELGLDDTEDAAALATQAMARSGRDDPDSIGIEPPTDNPDDPDNF